MQCHRNNVFLGSTIPVDSVTDTRIGPSAGLVSITSSGSNAASGQASALEDLSVAGLSYSDSAAIGTGTFDARENKAASRNHRNKRNFRDKKRRRKMGNKIIPGRTFDWDWQRRHKELLRAETIKLEEEEDQVQQHIQPSTKNPPRILTIDEMRAENWRLTVDQDEGQTAKGDDHQNALGGKESSVPYCHVYKYSSQLSSQQTRMACHVGSQFAKRVLEGNQHDEDQQPPKKLQRMDQDTARIQNFKAARIRNLQTATLPEPSECMKTWCQAFCDLYRPVFSGNCERKLPAVLQDGCRYQVLSAIQDLKVYDTTEGLHIPNTLTLIPRQSAIDNAPSPQLGLLAEYEAFAHLEKTANESRVAKTAVTRSSKRHVFKEGGVDDTATKYLNIGVKTNHKKGGGLFQRIKGLDNNQRHHQTIGGFVRSIERQTCQWLLEHDLAFLAGVKTETNFPGFDCGDGQQSQIFPAIAFGRNVFLNVHTDQDFFWSATTVIQKDMPLKVHNSPICNYFCFPTLGISVALRHGDILLFNPLVPHCISSRCDVTKDEFCISLYLKTAVVGGNNNNPRRQQHNDDDTGTGRASCESSSPASSCSPPVG
ncbi:unknown protein [Seminavis robusta]|uniref:Uncharacterized protein n=1 Tax=Seminavis robusta TaxID=568900 RepID=A0A9N8ER92_9STRA|nr:unknown protein [Seminavis robusta]|eukprot:Sro1855_g301940.1 n/a (596) ;mRNA; r:10769-12664